uniref:STE20-like serine/threonine-protein kinase n=1 Tax=Plectus sambesii TaxID=2011161 RepID=A0A914UQD7_9BILA
MSFLNKFKNLFRGGPQAPPAKALPSDRRSVDSSVTTDSEPVDSTAESSAFTMSLSMTNTMSSIDESTNQHDISTEKASPSGKSSADETDTPTMELAPKSLLVNDDDYPTPVAEEKRKRPAPLPPVHGEVTIVTNEITNTTHDANDRAIASPRGEAMEILEDLYAELNIQERMTRSFPSSLSPHPSEPEPEQPDEDAPLPPTSLNYSSTGNNGYVDSPTVDVVVQGIVDRVVHSERPSSRLSQNSDSVRRSLDRDRPVSSDFSAQDDRAEVNTSGVRDLKGMFEGESGSGGESSHLSREQIRASGNVRDRWERTSSSSGDGTLPRGSKEPIAIPSGLVKRNRDLAEQQQDEVVLRASADAAKIKEQRRVEDERLRGDDQRISVHQLAATFNVRPPPGDETAVVRVRSSFADGLDTSSESTAIQNRRSAPSGVFQERTNAVNAFLEQQQQQQQQQQRASKPKKQPAPAPPGVHRDSVEPDDGPQRVYFGGFIEDPTTSQVPPTCAPIDGRRRRSKESAPPPPPPADPTPTSSVPSVVAPPPVATRADRQEKRTPPPPPQPEEDHDMVVMPPPEPPPDYDQTPRQSVVVAPAPAAVDDRRRQSAPQTAQAQKQAQYSRDSSASSEGRRHKSNGTAQQRPAAAPVADAVDAAPHPQPAKRRMLAASNSQDTSATNGNGSALGARKSPHRRTVTKKTRVYMVDGVEVTSTTYHVMGGEGHTQYKAKEDFQLRKQELQDLKRMQREEARQYQELTAKTESLREQQEKKFLLEKQGLDRTFDVDQESLGRTQKRQIEEAERSQEEELRAASKRLKSDQEKDLRMFRDRLKQEAKILKQEVDILPKSQRKDALRIKKEQMEMEHVARERQFIEQLQKTHEQTISRMQDAHKQKIALLERQFLQQKHQLMRAKEAAVWELEERQLAERHQLFKQQLKDVFFLQRSQMLARHQKELEHVRKINQNHEDELVRGLAAEKKRLPKVLRAETKTRSLMFKESLRISMQIENSSELADKMRRFEEQEKQRVRRALMEHDVKSKRRLQALIDSNSAGIKELEHIQNEKRKMLLENEQTKLSQYEQEYEQVVDDWKNQLKPRKQVLETKFTDELMEQEKFYGMSKGDASNGSYASTNLAAPSPSSQRRPS